MSRSLRHFCFRRVDFLLRGKSFRQVRAAGSAALGILLSLALTCSGEAGDILRGGSAVGGPATGNAGGSANAATAAQARANAQDALARTTQALQSVKAMQSAARALAKSGPNNLGLDPNHTGQILPNVPNGLGAGGLQVAPHVPVDLLHPVAGEDPKLWQGAKLPVQSTAGGRTTVKIKQTAQQALLNWQTFNVGKETTVLFNQNAGGANKSQWIAFNFIRDPSGVPSQILGSIKAPGQVYLINQNGIIFGGASQINLHSLVASSLPINANLIDRGLLNNPDLQFLFSQLPIATISGGSMPAFLPEVPLTPDGEAGDVVVQKGAVLSAPTTPDHVGGRIALIGANVKNAGTISTPDGQIILAAGLQVGLAAHPSADPSLRGLDVSIGAVGSYAGDATNAGLIKAPRANVTIAGKSVEQLGAIDNTTSVALNGRIDLLANYNTTRSIILGKPQLTPTASGLVTLGPKSVTQILPELDSLDAVIGTELALRSQINAQGQAVHLAGEAQILAPNAAVTLNAGSWRPSSNSYAFTYTDGQIYLDRGASINVAGTPDVLADIAKNIISVELRGTELADAPLQREGAFRGATIQVDVRQSGIYNGFGWIGTPLADASGYVGLIERSVGELTIGGGSVKMRAGGSVVMQPGSRVDVSGGWINYQGGLVKTTRVISGEHIFDISQATPDLVYDGFSTGNFDIAHPKYGVTETFTSPLLSGEHFEAGYIYGGNGGRIDITAPSMALDGKLLGQTVAGPRQRAIAPTPSALSLIFQAQDPTPPLYPIFSPTPPRIVFQNENLPPVSAFALDSAGKPLALGAVRLAQVFLSPELTDEDGFGILNIDNSDGDIVVPAKVNLKTQPGGSITFAAANTTIAGNVAAPGGSLSFSVFNISPTLVAELNRTPGAQTPAANTDRGVFTLGAGASLSTAGLIVDDRVGADAEEMLPFAINGGAITINSYSAKLAAGSAIDVSGGVAIGATGKLTYGAGGSISIKAGQDLNLASVLGGELVLRSALTGFSGGKGGALSILAPSIQIGGATANPDTLLLSSDFFSRGGFSSFALSGLGATTGKTDKFLPGVLIAPGTEIAPIAKSWLAVQDAQNPDAIALQPIVMPEGMRAPVSLAFNAPGVADVFTKFTIVRGDFVMGEGSTIKTDALGSVSMSGNTAAVLGSVFAPGGRISVSGGKNSSTLFANTGQALPTVDLGPRSILSTAGGTLETVNPRGYRTGLVLPGGSISVSGNIVAEAGALLDVSGASDVLEFAPVYGMLNSPITGSLNGLTYMPLRIDSSGGSITLAGAQELFTDATLRGAAGGPSALGGSLSISSGRFIPPGQSNTLTPLDVTLTVTQNGRNITKAAIGKAVVDQNGDAIFGQGFFAANRFQNGGFDSLALRGTVKFDGAVSIDAARSLSISDGGVIFANNAVKLAAPYVALGTAFLPPVETQQVQSPFTADGQPFFFSPTNGAGTVSVRAQLIDIGNLSLQNIGSLKLIADGGDVRGDGTLDVAGDIAIRAAQIYPASAVKFTIAAYDFDANGSTQNGSVTIAASGVRQLPLSAGGELNVYGAIIKQGGVLRAPIGTINLGWDGSGPAPGDAISGQAFKATQSLTLAKNSVTSVSAIDPITGAPLLIPFGVNLNGTSWIDPAGNDITVAGVPSKAINIGAVKVKDRPGSLIDIRGGGDLLAYRFVSGIGGTRDILGASSSFAVLPGNQAGFAPYAAFNPNPTIDNFAGDAGYVNTGLAAGDRVYLGASEGLRAGFYTLLPARYALLPGAFLVTPRSGAPVGTVSLADGASIVSGYRVNGLGNAQTGQPLLASFEIASADVLDARAQYDRFTANAFITQAAREHDAAVPRLPFNAGHLVLSAAQTMTLQGRLTANGAGGLVDISSPVDIVIAGPKTASGATGLVLDSRELGKLGAESLLIGGVRTVGANGTTVTVRTNNLTVDNAGAPLTGRDLVLVANQSLTLASGAEIRQTGGGLSTDTLLLGNASAPGSGDGVLLRVSGDASAGIIRSGLSASTIPNFIIGVGAQISGAGLLFDSSSAMSLDSSAVLQGKAITFDSGKINLVLANAGSAPSSGLVLSGLALDSLQSSAHSLSLLSYSSIDIFGSGQIGAPSFASLSLHAGAIRGFDDGPVQFAAQTITLDNSANAVVPGAIGAANGSLEFNAGTIRLGANSLRVDRFSTLALNASGGILARDSGALTTQGDLLITAPLVTGAAAANHEITAGGALSMAATGQATVSGGLGATLALTGAKITVNSDIILPSGELTLRATTDDVLIGNLAASELSVGGVARTFFDLVKYTSGGAITLTSDAGNVSVAAGSTVDVSSHPDGGNAGTLSVSAPKGAFAADGILRGAGGKNGKNGSFSFDVGTLPDLTPLNDKLNTAFFTEARSIRVRNGNVAVGGLATAHTFDLSADGGSISITGFIDASGPRGGSIDLAASGDVLLDGGAKLSVAGQDFDAAGKGGSVSLETTGGRITLAANSTIDLSVASNAGLGDFSGTLHLRAPQVSGPDFVAIDPLAGNIVGASSIVAEGFFAQDANTTSAALIDSFKNSAFANATSFMNNAPAIQTRLLAGNAGLANVFHVRPGEEIRNSKGDLVLNNDWDLSTWRFGSKQEAGLLTLRAKGNLVFRGSLSDGFLAGGFDPNTGEELALWQESLLPAGSPSWSYRLTAGADLSAVDFHRVQSLSSVGANSGSLQLGVNGGNISNPFGPDATVATAIAGHYQVIRTGVGDIDISAGRNVQLLNQFATIYTAGTQVNDPSLGGSFDLPRTNTELGLYEPQYTLGGGNVTVTAQADILHQTRNNQGVLIADSERQLPMNWLYRRGYVNNAGQFGTSILGDVASTSWWIDYSNFFEGVGALGGGNITMIAGRDISNVDALIPTNARMPKGTPDRAKLVELGGGDLLVRAGHDIDGGVYYVERGQGILDAGNSIHTNSTRFPSFTAITAPASVNPVTTSYSWLPTTLFLGKGNFDVSAGGDLLLGPVSNPFLLPGGMNNSYFYKSYFSTYAATDSVNVSSLNGAITFRESATLPLDSAPTPVLQAWLQRVLLMPPNTVTASYYQPWLRLNETSVSAFATVATLRPPSLLATAFSNDINLVGNLTLTPSARGTVDLTAAGSINGMQPNGITTLAGRQFTAWGSSRINLSDANPDSLPGVASPFAYQSLVGTNNSAASVSNSLNLGFINILFNETGSTNGAAAVLETKQALHAPGILHLDDLDPVRLYAGKGNVSDLTLFAGKAARIVSGRDITDVALYLQNVRESDLSLVSAGRDIIAYNANSPLRIAAQSPGNALFEAPRAGDIQINGPGTLEVLAGRHLDLGSGANNADGTGVGITSIGNARNLYLPFEGADIIAAAGISASRGIEASRLGFAKFIDQFLAPGAIGSERYFSELKNAFPDVAGASNAQAFSKLSAEEQNRLALYAFFIVLRDAGRDHNDPASPGFGVYTAGLDAVAALFPNAKAGDITTQARDIRSKSGGHITLLAPGGGLTLASSVIGEPLAPPGIITEDGGNISIFSDASVDIGISRIFTLRGGNIVIWSASGDIAAGSSSKTVQSAPPTRVLIDPQTSDVQNDLAGLATGGGIGVLATVEGVPPGDVDLIAPTGTIDAGDAGIRVSGNLNLAAVQVLNASNIQVGGASAGVPTTVIAPPNLSGLAAASSAAGASNSTASDVAKQAANQATGPQEETPSVITVEVIGYGGEG